MTDFEMDKTYAITGREFLALLSLIPDGTEKAKAIVENVAGREKSAKVNESQIDFLKPCPFCGSTDVSLIQDRYGSWGIECHGYMCHAYLTNSKWRCERRVDAIALWNKRVIE